MRKLLAFAFAAAIVGATAWIIERLLAGRGEPVAAGEVASNGSVTRDQLYVEAQRLHVKGRSKMNKRQLEVAVGAARIGGGS
jgi:hypothetical protein